MNASPPRRFSWYYVIFAAVALGGALAAANLAAAIGRPFGGFYLTRSHATSAWAMHPATPPWWPVIASGQLRFGDLLLAVNDAPFGPGVGDLFARLYEDTNARSATLTVQRNGTIHQLTVPVSLFSLGNYLDVKLPDLIICFGFWLLAVAVFNAQAQNPANRIFALAASCVAGSLWLSIAGLFSGAPGLTQLLEAFWILPASLVGITVLHLTTLYPDPVHRSVGPWLKLGYGCMLCVALVYMSAYAAQQLIPTASLPAGLLRYCNLAVIGSFGLGVLAYFARLVYLLTRPSISRRLRRQTAILVLGVMLALPHVIIIVLRDLAGINQGYFVLDLDLRYLTLAVPVSFAFVILRYQTLQRIHPTVAAVFILATSALLASVTAWFMRELEPAWANTLNVSPFFPLFVVSMLTATFYSFQNTLRGAFSKVFQWEYRSYTAVLRFTQHVIARPDPATLPATLANALVEKLELDCAAVWVTADAGQVLRLAGQAGRWPDKPPAQLAMFGPPGREPTRPLRVAADNPYGPGWLSSLAEAGAIEIAAPLIASGNLVGVLGLGKRWDEEIFDDRDLDIMELVAQEAALFILTAQQIQALRQVPQQITTAQERERFKIAQELHDTVQQFLGRLPFYLEVSQKNARSNPAETEAILQRCMTDVEAAAQAVRHIRSSLAPLQLESSLLAPLENLVETFRARTGILVETRFDRAVDIIQSADARHALFRVVQQALDNVAAHADASQVILTISVGQGRLYFSVADNGKGVSPVDRSAAESSGSFGLISMRARMTGVGGDFALDSEPGAGTTIRGWLPVV